MDAMHILYYRFSTLTCDQLERSSKDPTKRVTGSLSAYFPPVFMAHVWSMFFFPTLGHLEKKTHPDGFRLLVGRTHVGFCGSSEATSRTSTTPWVAKGAVPVVVVVLMDPKEWVKDGKKAHHFFTDNHEESWWFEIFFIFIPIWGNDPIWLIFFRWVWNHQLDDKVGWLLVYYIIMVY